MQIQKGTSYYLISGATRDTLLVIVHELWKRAINDKYREVEPEKIALATRMAHTMEDLENLLRGAEGGKAL